MTEVRYKQRQQNTQIWNQTYSCGLFNSNCGYKTAGYLYQWEYNQGTGTWVITNPTAKPADAATCSGALGCTSTSGSTQCMERFQTVTGVILLFHGSHQEMQSSTILLEAVMEPLAM